MLSLLFTAGALAQNCAASFTSSVSPANGAMVMFNNTSTASGAPGASTSYSWNFGDGNWSNLTNPSHTYNTSGAFAVCLTIYYIDSMAGTSCTDTYCDSVVVSTGSGGGGGGGTANCTALFSYSHSTMNPAMVLFTNSSTHNLFQGSSVSYSWDFGDGNTSSATNPSHNYANNGGYIVCLTINVLDSAGGVSCTDTYCDSLLVSSGGGGGGGGTGNNCQASFVHYPDSTGNSLSGAFVSTSNTNPNQIVTYSWDFGDGNTSSSSNVWTNHTYAQAGTYLACLTITVIDSGVTCTDTYCDTIVVVGNGGNQLVCNASFWVDSSATNATGFFIYNNSTPLSTTTSTTSYFWDFGDGNSSTSPYPTHQYASSGIYNLCLTIMVIDVNGDTCSDTYCHPLGVDSLGNVIFKTNGPGFTLNVLDPSTIGLNENILDDVSIYPNPANGEVTLDLGAQVDGDVVWSIVDLKGRNLATGEVSELNTKIDINNLNTGIYILTVKSGEAVSNHKLQVVK